MWNNIIRNWKTSGAAAVMAAAGIFVVFFPTQSDVINKVAQGIVLLAGAIIGLCAKDGDRSGTANNPNP